MPGELGQLIRHDVGINAIREQLPVTHGDMNPLPGGAESTATSARLFRRYPENVTRVPARPLMPRPRPRGRRRGARWLCEKPPVATSTARGFGQVFSGGRRVAAV